MPKDNNANVQEVQSQNNAEKKVQLKLSNAYNNIKRYTGPDADPSKRFVGADRIKEVKIDVDAENNITSEFIQLVTLGSYIDSENMKRTHHSENGVDPRDYIFMNVISEAASSGGGRDYTYQVVLYEARENAKKAIDEIRENPELANKYLTNVIKYYEELGYYHKVSHESEGQVFYALNELILKNKDNPLFDTVRLETPNKVFNQCAERVEIGKKYREGAEAEKTLLQNLPAAGSAERKELIKKVLTPFVMHKFISDTEVEISNELLEDAGIKQIGSKAYFDQNILPYLREHNMDYAVKQTRMMYNSGLFKSGVETAAQKIANKLETYQHNMLINEINRDEYYNNIEKIIEKSDVFESLLEITDVAEFEKKLTEAKEIKFKVKDFEIEDDIAVDKEIPFNIGMLRGDISDGVKLNYRDKLFKDNKVIDEYKRLVEANAQKLIKSAIDYEVDSNINEVGKEQGKYVKQEFLTHIRKNMQEIGELDFDKAYVDDENKEFVRFDIACRKVLRENASLYVKKKTGGFVQLDLKLENNKAEITHKLIQSVPYKSNDSVQTYHTKRVNAEAAKMDSAKTEPGYLESYAKANAYKDYAKSVYGENHSFARILDKFSKGLEDAYKNGVEGENRSTMPTIEVYDSLLAQCNEVKQSADEAIQADPFDQFAKDVKSFVEGDIKIINGIKDFEKNSAASNATDLAAEIIRLQEKNATPDAGSPIAAKGDAEWTKSLEERKTDGEHQIENFAGSKAKPREGFLGGERLAEAEILLDEANGITEEVVRAITFGAYLDKESLGRRGDDNLTMDERAYFIDTLIADHTSGGNAGRDEAFNMPMFEARERVAKALEDYKAGNRTAVDRYAKNFGKFITEVGLVHDATTGSQGMAYFELFNLTDKVVNSELLAEAGMSEETLKKVQEKLEIGRLTRQAYDKERELSKNILQQDSAQRKEMLLDILTASVVDQIQGAYVEDIVDSVYASDFLKTGKQGPEDKGIMSKDYFSRKVLPFAESFLPEDYREIKAIPNLKAVWEGNVQSGLFLETDNYKKKTVTYQTEMLNDAEAKQKYYAKIRDMIQSTKQFDEMMATENPKKLKEMLDKVKKNYKELKVREYSIVDGKVTTAENSFDFSKIPDNDFEKSIYNDRKNDNNGKTQEIIRDVEAQSLLQLKDSFVNRDKMFSPSFLKKAEQAKKLLEEKIESLGLLVDMKDYYYKGIKSNDLDEDIKYAIKNNRSIYFKLKPDAFLSCSFEKKRNGEFDVNTNVIYGVPYKEFDYIKEAAASRQNRIFAELRIKEDRPEYSKCYRKLSSYIDVIKAAGSKLADKPDIYKGVEDTMVQLETKINDLYDNYKNGQLTITAEKYIELRKAYSDCDKAIKAYWKRNPFDNCVNSVAEMIAEDVKVYDAAIGDPEKTEIKNAPNLIEATLKAKNAVLRKDITDNKITLQNVQANATDTVRRNKAFSSAQYTLTVNIDKAFILEKLGGELMLNPDGTFYKDGNNYMKLNGEAFTPKKQAEYIAQHSNELDAFIQKSFASYRDIDQEAKIDPKLFNTFMKMNGIKGAALDEKEMEIRKSYSMVLEKKYQNYLAKNKIEGFIAGDGNTEKVPREALKFLKIDGSNESREYNKTLITKITSNNPTEVKEAYEMMLHSLAEMKPEAHNLLDQNYMHDHANELFDFQEKALEIQHVFENAKKAKVNLDNPDFAKLIDNAGMIENLGNDWKQKMLLGMHPISDVFKIGGARVSINDMKAAAEYAEQIAEGTKDFNLAEGQSKSDFSYIASGLGKMVELNENIITVQGNWLKKGKESFAEKYNKAVKLSPKNPIAAPEDSKLLGYRNELANHKVSKLIGTHENSKFYTDIIDAIDEYRAANATAKEYAREKLAEKCTLYIANRSSFSERTKMIKEFVRYVNGDLKKAAKNHVINGRRCSAEKIKDFYVDSIKNISKIPGRGVEANAILSVLNEAGQKRLVDILSKTDLCVDLDRNPEMFKSNNRERLWAICNTAITQAMNKIGNAEEKDANNEIGPQEIENPNLNNPGLNNPS